MNVILPALASALNGDAELGNLVSAVRMHRAPTEPSKLVKPVVVFRVADGTDIQGAHGAAVNLDVEVEVWGYDAGMVPECTQAAQRISEIIVGTRLSLATGGHTRWGERLGWQTVNDPDDGRVVLLRATFGCRYWSRGRISAVAT